MYLDTSSLHKAWNHSLSVSNLVFAKLFHVPALALQRTGQHRTDLVDEECPGWMAVQAADHKPACPLDPFAEVVRVQNVLEQPVLRYHVYLVDALKWLLLLCSLSTLFAIRCSTDLAKVVVVEHVAQ